MTRWNTVSGIIGGIVTVVVVGYLIWHMAAVSGPAAFEGSDRVEQANQQVQSATANYNEVTTKLIAFCMGTLPDGTGSCDADMERIMDYCNDANPIERVQLTSCSDPRVREYLQTRTNYESLPDNIFGGR